MFRKEQWLLTTLGLGKLCWSWKNELSDCESSVYWRLDWADSGGFPLGTRSEILGSTGSPVIEFILEARLKVCWTIVLMASWWKGDMKGCNFLV